MQGQIYDNDTSRMRQLFRFESSFRQNLVHLSKFFDGRIAVTLNTWEHTNTNSFSHPIIGVLLRRIKIAEEKQVGRTVTEDEIIRRWFVSNVYTPVLIIRDIQNKLIKHKRDKSAHLLDGDKNDFWSKTNFSLTEQRDISRITLSYCQNIRETWANYTAGKGQVLQNNKM